jgi:hypothetical protein
MLVKGKTKEIHIVLVRLKVKEKAFQYKTFRIVFKNPKTKLPLMYDLS